MSCEVWDAQQINNFRGEASTVIHTPIMWSGRQCLCEVAWRGIKRMKGKCRGCKGNCSSVDPRVGIEAGRNTVQRVVALLMLIERKLILLETTHVVVASEERITSETCQIIT